MAESSVVPAADAEGKSKPDGEADDRYSKIELRVLDADAKAKESLNHESDQRYLLRWIAVSITVIIIIAMGALLYHVSHRLMTMTTFGANPAYVIAVYVAPIISMTALSVALLVAAFRGFKESDAASGLAAASDSARTTGILG